ncbi:MAG: enoyl-CoA hydratase/isomerase family protein [Magnetovibrionaceae bacterium]
MDLGPNLTFEVIDNVGWLTLNRPEARNALTYEMYEGLRSICSEDPRELDIKVLVITGAGEKAFAAGTDIAQFRDMTVPQDAIDYESKMDRVFEALETLSIPTVAAVSGACTGGGGAIAASCDLRIATRSMKFGFPIARTLGNCLSAKRLARLAHLLGPGRTKDLLFTSRLIEADEALAIGLVSEIVPDHGALMDRVKDLAETLKHQAPITLACTKEALRRLTEAACAIEDEDLIVKAYMSEDFREGMEAFLAKRKPDWKGV